MATRGTNHDSFRARPAKAALPPFGSAVAASIVVLLAASLLYANPPRVIEELSGKVVSVADGDTVTVLVIREQVKVRLEGIDARQSKQSFGTRSKQALAEMVFGKTVTVGKTGNNRYRRPLGLIVVDGVDVVIVVIVVDVNAKRVEDGWAWHYKQCSRDGRLAALEVETRQAKRGLWAAPAPQAPWEFRAKQRVPKSGLESDGTPLTDWLNVPFGVRHNSTCEHFGQTKRGRSCGPDEGKSCGKFGG